MKFFFYIIFNFICQFTFASENIGEINYDVIPLSSQRIDNNESIKSLISTKQNLGTNTRLRSYFFGIRDGNKTESKEKLILGFDTCNKYTHTIGKKIAFTYIKSNAHIYFLKHSFYILHQSFLL